MGTGLKRGTHDNFRPRTLFCYPQSRNATVGIGLIPRFVLFLLDFVQNMSESSASSSRGRAPSSPSLSGASPWFIE